MGLRARMARFTSKKRELMRAVWRLAVAVLAVGLSLGPLPALAQDATQPAQSNTPATDAIGPRDLQNFSLNGTVTRSADPVAVPRASSRAPATTRSQPPATTSASPTQADASPAPVERAVERAPARVAQSQAPTEPPPSRTAPASPAITAALPPISDAPVSETAAADTLAPPAESLAGEHRLLLWPWLLAALALGAGGAFLFWRNHRSREAFAGGPQIDAFVAPETAPAPPRAAPQPAPPKASPPPPLGVVSTRLRPWIELAFQPGRCIVEDDKVTFEFELGLQNSGNAPARAVLVEASLMNAGPHQDDEVSAFFGAPVGEGERIAVIPPLKTVIVKTKVVAPRANVQLLEIGGRQVFVPLIAFNALYDWSGGEGQTSASFMLGRDTKGEKLAPFRLELGPRIVRSVGARPLPIAVRK
jgi:hypothetical protein